MSTKKSVCSPLSVLPGAPVGKSEVAGLSSGEPLGLFMLIWEVLQFEPHEEVAEQLGVPFGP